MAKNIGRGRGHGQRLLRVEALERRAMLAGNVTVSVSGGTLNIRGDGEDNAVFITEVEEGVYAVVGFDDLSGSPTSINGVSNGELVFGGVTRDINIDLKGGDDLLAIGNDEGDLIDLIEECGLNFGSGSGSGSGSVSDSASLLEVVPEGSQTFVPRDLIIRTGDGDDQVALIVAVNRIANINLGKNDDAIAVGTSQFGDDLLIATEQGFDFVCADENEVGDLFSVQTGDDADAVSVSRLSATHAIIDTGKGSDEVGASGLSLEKALNIKTGDGDDFVSLFEFELGDDLLVDTGAGADRVFANSFIVADLVKVVTGSGDDPDVELTSFIAKNVLIDTGSGNDGTNNDESPITVENASVEQDIKIFTGSGFDLVDVFFVGARDLIVDTGSQDDDVVILDVEFDRDLKIFTGSGRDFVVLDDEEGYGVFVGRDLHIDTGSDSDEVDIDDTEIGRNALIVLGSNSSGEDSTEFLFIEDTFVAGNAKIDAGSGNDVVVIEDSEVGGKFTAIMGSGNDFLRICNSIAGSALLDGGSGTDELQSDLDIDDLPDGYTVKNFELFSECEEEMA